MAKYNSLKYNEKLFQNDKRKKVNIPKLLFGILLLLIGIAIIVYILLKYNDGRVWFSLFSAPVALIGVRLIFKSLSRKKTVEDVTREINYIDTLSGEEFELFCAKLLRISGYEDIEVNGSSGDQGADILAKRDGIRYAVQCKHRLDPYKTKYGNKPVQEVHASLRFYNCDAGFVITNGYFTKGGIDAAAVTGVLLWDRDTIISMLKKL